LSDTTQYKMLDLEHLQPPMNVTVVTPEHGLPELAQFVAEKLAKHLPMGFDTESNWVHDFFFRILRTIQVGDKEQQFVIDLLAFAGTPEKLASSQGYYKLDPIYKPIFDILTPALCGNAVLKVGQNLSFEYEVMCWNFGQRIWHLYSTDLAERVIQAGRISLKRMVEFSMRRIVERRFNVTVDKEEQDKFNPDAVLTPKMILYAAFDTRMPLSMRESQIQEMTKDRLLSTALIENDALGSYSGMHLNGLLLDGPRWLKRLEGVVERRKDELQLLDIEFIKLVGKKNEQIDFEEMNRREIHWRNDFELASPGEMAKAEEIRATRDNAKKAVLRAELAVLKKVRTEAKQVAHQSYLEISKNHTKWKNKVESCEGEAYLNYGSNDQLLDTLKKVRGMSTLKSVADDDLLEYNDRPFIQTLRKYRKGKKDTGTYGVQWAQTWITKASSEEGWVHPWDHRIHAKFNQLEAETGRSSSEKPSVMNLPKDDTVRACFIAREPDELIRISTCCNELAEFAGTTLNDKGSPCEPIYGKCEKCGNIVPTIAEEYVLVTTDMSGAELRIIAELANATSWIRAFANGWDVHSVSTEILEPEKWANGAAQPGELDKEGKPLPPCAYFELNEKGEQRKQKCKCPKHEELRDHTKAINFLLCYGGGPDALADELGITKEEAKRLMKQHEAAFPDVWRYLRESGEKAQRLFEARDLYLRRRSLPKPTYESAKEYFKDEHADRLELPEEVQKQNIFNFTAEYLRKPTGEEKHKLTHREPTDNEIRQAMRGLIGSIGRRGKNHCIQGSNASIIKRSLGCGFDAQGVPYLWHSLPQYKAKLLSMIHDELVVECPKRFGQKVAELVADAFKRAAAEVMHKVEMKSESRIADRWQK
jgi:DNA polymerase I-like protein with 3'-5' exonuclease and polymerase domains